MASLRKIGVPLAQIKVILSLETKAAAEQVAAFWAGPEADHAARRELARYLVDRLNGKESVMYEVGCGVGTEEEIAPMSAKSSSLRRGH